jgi:hypothetical protein
MAMGAQFRIEAQVDPAKVSDEDVKEFFELSPNWSDDDDAVEDFPALCIKRLEVLLEVSWRQPSSESPKVPSAMRGELCFPCGKDVEEGIQANQFFCGLATQISVPNRTTMG